MNTIKYQVILKDTNVKKTTLFSALALTLFSTQTLAVVNGTPIDWSTQDDTVRIDSSINSSQYCTATLIAGRYAITASHCLQDDKLDTVMTASHDAHTIANSVLHPEYEDAGQFDNDVALAELNTSVDYHDIHFLNVGDLTDNEPVHISGFGGTIETLNRADFTFSHAHWTRSYIIYLNMVNESHTTGGDSGSAWVNDNDEIVAIHGGSRTVMGERETYGTDLTYSYDFILETVNGWHYPTLAQANGKTTITVQSLHQ
ncbi:trypsin-like serine protease, partial [uncultured Vibrio sp.]|uniref:trypsin-like serine protease n=1 Tax=uncultured Vibrio sp. TaxID=114054 RepID=UPI002622B15B